MRSGGDAGGGQRALKIGCVFGCDGDQQPAGGLRVEEHGPDVVGDAIVVSHHAFGEVAIAFRPPGM